MESLHFVRKRDRKPLSGDLSLVVRRANMEIMHQRILPDSVAWICPAENPEITEFFYVLRGKLSVGEGTDMTELEAGDCFYTAQLDQDVRLQAYEESELLYIADTPLAEELASYHAELDSMTLKIDEKDHQTLNHSRKVMFLSVRIFRELGAQGIPMDDLVAASLFHDVGKCQTPDEILKKESRITLEEYERMKHHPLDSHETLRRFFGESVAQLARWHHERLDGSGYPDHLTGDEIPLGARILAVADSFDAMTAGRPYAQKKSYEQALEELREMHGQYDGRVVEALARVVSEAGFSLEDTREN